VSTTRPRCLAIVTFGRSGSTVLQSVLNAHPDTLIRGENYNALTGLWDYWTSIVDSAGRHHSGKPNHPWFGTAKMAPVEVREDLTNHVFDALLRPKNSTTWTGFKEVRYEAAYFSTTTALCSYLLFLQELLPDLCFLLNTRDPETAARSGWWQQHPNAQEILHQTNDIFRSSSTALTNLLGEQRVQLIDYDSWRAKPELLFAALTSMGFPADKLTIERALSEILTHGQSQVEGNE